MKLQFARNTAERSLQFHSVRRWEAQTAGGLPRCYCSGIMLGLRASVRQHLSNRSCIQPDTSPPNTLTEICWHCVSLQRFSTDKERPASILKHIATNSYRLRLLTIFFKKKKDITVVFITLHHTQCTVVQSVTHS